MDVSSADSHGGEGGVESNATSRKHYPGSITPAADKWTLFQIQIHYLLFMVLYAVWHPQGVGGGGGIACICQYEASNHISSLRRAR